MASVRATVSASSRPRKNTAMSHCPHLIVGERALHERANQARDVVVGVRLAVALRRQQFDDRPFHERGREASTEGLCAARVCCRAAMLQRFKGRVAVTSFAGLALAIASTAFGCSRHEGEETAAEDADTQEPEWVPPHRHDAGIDAGFVLADGGAGFDASDGRAEHELALLLDAGHFCGARDLHDCPLQGWMKRNATTMLEFGDISTIGIVFDQIATLGPTDTIDDGGLVYANWKSISHDGANASRMGNLNAAKAACRGCHTQYRAQYHANMRARDIPAAPLVPTSAPSSSAAP